MNVIRRYLLPQKHSMLFLIQTLLVVVLAIIALTAVLNGLYVRFWWLDILAHNLGGMWVACAILALHERIRPGVTFTFWRVVGLVLLVGISWEVFELMLHVPQPYYYEYDTMKDIVDDVLGGSIGYFLGRFLYE